MSETLTGKAALLAILDGTHWWICGDRRLSWARNFWQYAGRWTGDENEMDIVLWTWTRGEPIDVEVPE